MTRRLRPCSKKEFDATQPKHAVRNTNAQCNTDAPLFEKKPFVPTQEDQGLVFFFFFFPHSTDPSTEGHKLPSRHTVSTRHPEILPSEKPLDHRPSRPLFWVRENEFPEPEEERMSSEKGRNRKRGWETGQERMCVTQRRAPLCGSPKDASPRRGPRCQRSVRPRGWRGGRGGRLLATPPPPLPTRECKKAHGLWRTGREIDAE